jgi:hypothetical protein
MTLPERIRTTHCKRDKREGFPQLHGKIGETKSYAERLFDFSEIGPLDGSTD